MAQYRYIIMGNYLSISKENESASVDTSIIDNREVKNNIPPTPNTTPILGSTNINEGTKIEVNPIDVTAQTDVFKKLEKNED
jgi:hypothetical protein